MFRGLIALAATLVIAGEASALDLEMRRMLSAEESVPWRGVGRVNIESMSQSGMCTGTLIAEDLVLTAAHCVVNRFTNKPFPPGNVHFVAGWRRGSKVAHRKAAALAVHPDYTDSGKVEISQISADLAIIRLESPIPMDKAPFFQVGRAEDWSRPLKMISYRGDRAHALTRQDGCDVLDANAAMLALDCDVIQGASGSPLFLEVDGHDEIVAVLSAMAAGEGRKVAFAVRVDAALADLLAILP